LETWPNGVHNGGFPQVSGISYKIDGSMQAGNRLVSVTKDGKPLDKDKIYKVALVDYMKAGGDGYEMFKDAKVISRGGLLRDVVVKYIQSKGIISVGLEGRITVINEKYK